MKGNEVIREAVAEMFDILSYKVRHGVMNVSDLKAILAVIEEAGGIKATIKELASFYGQSEDNVRHVVHRGLIQPPERKVYYDFGAFRQIVPAKWHHHHSLPAD